MVRLPTMTLNNPSNRKTSNPHCNNKAKNGCYNNKVTLSIVSRHCIVASLIYLLFLLAFVAYNSAIGKKIHHRKRIPIVPYYNIPFTNKVKKRRK
jgi:hypothetical protein